MIGLATGDPSVMLPDKYRGMVQPFTGKKQLAIGAMNLAGNAMNKNGNTRTGSTLKSLASLAGGKRHETQVNKE
jgi:hypothetical protein